MVDDELTQLLCYNIVYHKHSCNRYKAALKIDIKSAKKKVFKYIDVDCYLNYTSISS